MLLIRMRQLSWQTITLLILSLFLIILGNEKHVLAIMNSPKIITKDGNLIFEAGLNRNISFRLNGKSRLNINDKYDLLNLLLKFGHRKAIESEGNDEWSSADRSENLHKLTADLSDLESLVTGHEGLNTKMTRLDNRTSRAVIMLRSYQMRLRHVELKMLNLTGRLELNGCRSNPCENGGSCLNTFNGFACKCSIGFEGVMCERDVNECALYEGTDLGCQNGAQCFNQVGTFSCVCAPGWFGIHCTQRKVDCLQSSTWELCGHGTCVSSNDASGYKCVCEQGWKTNGLTPACSVDVDECTAETHTPCTTNCINLPGSFTCAPCAPGLTGNGVTCRDVDECATNNGGCSLSPRVKCVNTYGTYHCGECPFGWIGDGRTCVRSASEEYLSYNGGGTGTGISGFVGSNCAQAASICHPEATCREISNTVVCSCPAGMVGSGIGAFGCIRGTANNCNSLPCLNGGICVDVGSNYSCICPVGYRPPNCATSTNACQPNPCHNGGRCRPLPGNQFICQCMTGYKDKLCQTRFSHCGGVLAGGTGRLRYPPDGTSYEHNAQCAWLLRTNETFVLNVTFNAFELEDATECRFDWLQINDGRTAATQLIGRFCGSRKPHGGQIISTTNELYLWFRSDNSTSKEGFDLEWNSIIPQCGGIIDLKSYGTITTPGSPGNYPKNRDCRWRLRAPNDKRIKLTFFSLEIEKHDSCNYDYVEIHDLISNNLLHKFCNSTHPVPLLLPTNEAEIHFHSDSISTDSGFQVHYSMEERIPGCGGTYTAKEGEIKSPDYADKGEISCEYDIRMAIGESITIEFIIFKMSDNECIEIYDININQNDRILQSKFCGEYGEFPAPFNSLYNAVQIKYHANAGGSFRLKYRMECSYTFENSSSIVQSPNYPNLTNTECLCTYKILSEPNTVIALEALDFDLKDSSWLDSGEQEDNVCLATYLKITDGFEEKLHGTYCNSFVPEKLISSTNMLMLKFKTSSSTSGRGFRISYTSLPIGKTDCGGIYTKPNQTIRLPTGDNNVYLNDVTCYWFIMAPNKKGIMLNWKSFNLEPSTDCIYDYVELYDNLSDSQPLVRYCDSRPPQNIVTHSHLLKIKFVSDFGDAADGFELNYDFIDLNNCGGNILSSTGKITLPEFSGNYTNNMDCQWLISTQPGTQLELQIELFELEQSKNCTSDWLSIRNGGSNESTLIGRFCGTTIPRHIPSFTNQLVIDFHSDSFINARGFRLTWRVFGNGCGGIMNAENGVITSPMYPNSYPNSAQCEWRIIVNKGSSIHFTIEDLEMEDNFDCYYDNLQIFEGHSTMEHPLLRICHLIDGPVQAYTQKNEATLVFRTDATTSDRGFRLSFYTNCTHTITDINGVIESLNFGKYNYERNINCSWTIQAPKGNKITFEITHLNYLTTPENGLYSLYYEEILLDGSKHVAVINEINSFTSASNMINIVHNTSSINFRLEYKMDGCIYLEHRETGHIQTPNYPGMYDNDIECLWEIRTEPGKGIELSINELNIEDSVNCTKDALIISNHKNEYNVKERHCGVQSKLVITSSSHRMYVRFISDNSHNGKGFKANYRTLDSPCGGKMKSKNGIIMSPNYPNAYLPSTNCEWNIEVSSHHRIALQIDELDIEMGFDCSWDYVEGFDVVENDNESNELPMFKLCGSVMNTTLFETTSNLAIVRFNADDSNQAKGFKLHYHETCGERVVINETVFSYLQIARHVQTNETCKWQMVSSDSAKHIIFTPTHIQLHPSVMVTYPTDGDCMEHGIKIYDGIEAIGVPRVKFCHSHPPAIISSGNALTITVPTDVVMEFEGHYMTMDTLCGSEYDSLMGKFTSPYYPFSYPVNIDCQWFIEASAGNSITLTFESMDLEESEECNNDYIEVREDSAMGHLLGVFCGNNVPPAILGRNSLWIRFKSNNDIVGEGFMASYNYEKHNEISGMNGTIRSPRYPSKLHSTEPYSWRITVDKDYAILINIKHIIDVDIPYIKLYDGYTDIGMQIDYTNTRVVMSNTNVLYFTAMRGPFEFEWERLSKEVVRLNRSAEHYSEICGNQVITLNNSIFNSPGYPNGYEARLQCSWTFIPANAATHITLQINKLELEEFDQCFADYVRVSESSDLHSWHVLDKICSKPNKTTPTIYHGKPYIKLDFVTDDSVNKTGFSSFLSTECGTELTGRRGFVNITQLMTPSTMYLMECIWTIRVRQGRRVRITFIDSLLHDPNDLSITSIANCRTFFLVRNGFSSDSPFLGRGKYCNNNITDILETSSNHAYIKFKRAGFLSCLASFRYEEISHECSEEITLTDDGSLEASSKIIMTPRYPNLPNPHSECVWKITVPVYHVVALEFIGDIDLSQTSHIVDNCDHEYIQINDGSTELMPMLARYCGKQRPNTVYSTSNVLRLKYFTDVSEPRLGFKAKAVIGRCGGTYYGNEGVISSPDNLLVRSDDSSFECVYTIEVEKGSTINLDFENMQLPQSANCTDVPHLALEEIDAFVENGAEKITDTLQLCGSVLQSYDVETNKVIIRYKLLGRSPEPHDGFKLRYKAIQARCGETIIAYRGILQSPSYPVGVRIPTHCSWRIQVPKGHRIKVEVLDFDTGASKSNFTVRQYRGRLIFANDFNMQSIIGRYSDNPPAVIYSMDNTMGIDTLLLPFSRHRGIKLRFSADGESECHSQFNLRTIDRVSFKRMNNSVLYCTYDLDVGENETLALNIVKHVSRMFINNPYMCSALTPLKLQLYKEQLLPKLLCQNDTIPTVRLPFPTHLELSGNKRNELEELELEYKIYNCGGVVKLEDGDNMTITQPKMNADYGNGKLECAWAIWPHDFSIDNLEDLRFWRDDAQIEISLTVDFNGNCSDHYLLLYNGPDQNSPLLGKYCIQATSANLVVERGLFFEYHTSSYEKKSTFNLTVKFGSGCGGKLSYPYRNIYFGEQYKNNVECIWEIETEPGFHIGLSFIQRFYIESSDGCKKDYLKVQQKQSDAEDWVDLQTLCGREVPKPVNTTTTVMRLIFRSDGDITADGFTAKFERNCGGILYATKETALLTSPGYPVQYEKNLFCNYTILPENSNAPGILIRFLDFDLEQPPINKCIFDNVTIQMIDKQDNIKESVICGVIQKHEYRAKKSISIILRTDFSFSGKGFKLDYSTNMCGAVIMNSTLIESPHQHTDNMFPHNTNCYWNLTAPLGYKITIKFKQIDFESQVACRFDGIEIYKGAAPLYQQRMATFCGNLTGRLPTLTIPFHQGLIRSFSDEINPSVGFKALVKFVPDCDQHIFLDTNNLTYNFNKYAGGYDNNVDCSYIFKTTADRQLQVEFSSFHLEVTPKCVDDYLEIRDGSGPFADLIGQLCGNDMPAKLLSSRNILFMRFVSDGAITDTGFTAAVTATPQLCGVRNIKLDDKMKSTLITSPKGEDGKYPNDLNCYWSVSANKNLHFEFVEFDIEEPTANGTCDSDYLKIYNSEQKAALVEQGYGTDVIFNGHTGGNDFNGFATEHIYCGSGTPNDYYPNANNIYLRFHTNNAIAKHGFSLKVTQIEGCFRNYTGIQGRIKLIDSSDHCDVYILAPANHTLSIYYSDLKFSEYDCNEEYIEVFDLHTNKSLQMICSYTEVGKSLFSNTNELRMRIKMNNYYTEYDMTYVASRNGPGCGGDLYNTVGTITNAYYPNNVRNNSDCRWNIRVPSNNHVLLRFDEFNMGAKSTCVSDYLQIIEHDGNGSEQVMRQYCGEDRPVVYKSNRSYLTVRFHKTLNFDGTGWVLSFYAVDVDYQPPTQLQFK